MISIEHWREHRKCRGFHCQTWNALSDFRKLRGGSFVTWFNFSFIFFITTFCDRLKTNQFPSITRPIRSRSAKPAFPLPLSLGTRIWLHKQAFWIVWSFAPLSHPIGSKTNTDLHHSRLQSLYLFWSQNEILKRVALGTWMDRGSSTHCSQCLVHMLGSYIHWFEFWLVEWLDYLCPLWLVTVITLAFIFFIDTHLKTALLTIIVVVLV